MMAVLNEENPPQKSEFEIIKITEEIHRSDVNRQKRRLELGIKRKTLLTANLEITKEYFEGIVFKFIEENKSNPFNELVEDLVIDKVRDGINSRWEFCKSDFGSFGKIGQINVDWVNEKKCSIRIDVFPPCPQPELDVELLLYKTSIKVLKRFGNLLHEELLAEPNITENQVVLPIIHKKGKRGRPHLEEDIWAHEQVNDLGRPYAVVYKEWQRLIENEDRYLADPKRQFSRVIKQDWLSDKNDNNE